MFSFVTCVQFATLRMRYKSGVEPVALLTGSTLVSRTSNFFCQSCAMQRDLYSQEK